MPLARRLAVVSVALLLVSLLDPSVAQAQEVTLVVGRFLGDEVSGLGPLGSLGFDAGFQDASLYGVRVGVGALMVRVEGSIVTSSTRIGVDEAAVSPARATFAEVNGVLSLFPGPFSAFLTGGIGHHKLSVEVAGSPSHSRMGYNIGGGITVGLGSIGVRADFRDHITPLVIDDVDPAFASAIGLEQDRTLHNYELSLGLVLRF